VALCQMHQQLVLSSGIDCTQAIAACLHSGVWVPLFGLCIPFLFLLVLFFPS
uniref:Uncharacterized protein n=1 Tax=Aegilops tauschii subsp. strangulata TaxID=200361 RepID=A0A453PQU5_AEGTS